MAERIGQGTYIEQNPFLHVFDRGLVKAFVRELKISGGENLLAMRRLLQEGHPMVIFPNHLSHADGPILYEALVREGYRDIAKKLRFVVGSVITEHPVANLLVKGFRGIKIPAHRMRTKTPEERARRIEMIEDAHNAAGLSINNGEVLVVYAQGGRGTTGAMEPALKGMNLYLNLAPGTFACPVALYGQELILPRDTKVPRFGGAEIKFGIPAHISVLYGLTKGVSDDKKGDAMIDILMRDIAKMLPPEYRGVYSDITAENGRFTI